jgi:hypothetical protein
MLGDCGSLFLDVKPSGVKIPGLPLEGARQAAKIGYCAGRRPKT